MLMKKKFILDVNPSNGEIIEKIKCSSTAEIASALKLAKKALKTWSDTPLKNKLIIFRKILRDLEKDKKEIARIISSEVGKSFESALNEIEASISLIEVNCLISSDILNNIINREGNIVTEIVR
jgi:malonate-semialdehyde dehydrogenase (acetylating)/methylmalonate-semialdehyde dehydrogenase